MNKVELCEEVELLLKKKKKLYSPHLSDDKLTIKFLNNHISDLQNILKKIVEIFDFSLYEFNHNIYIGIYDLQNNIKEIIKKEMK